MNFNEVYTDYKKRFGREKERAYFVGKPVVFFSCRGLTAGCCVSVGGCAALARRDDDRIIVQFSDSEKFINCSKSDLENNKDEKVCALLLKAETLGADLRGAEILLHYNSGISHPYQPLIMTAMKGFCNNVPDVRELAGSAGNYEKNMLALSGRQNCAAVMEGGQVRYLPLDDGAVKIVLCYTGDKPKNTAQGNINTARAALEELSRGDYEKFGGLLSRYTEELLAREKSCRRASRLHKMSVQLGDAYGSGILEDGGIYAIVKNDRVDTFMHNLSEEYRKYCGAPPEFYVTKAEDSGIICG
ncbi:MAG: hypothetical protein PUE13_08100 [Clostridiales bacterium]|nr:hypothetical protein [Clostridiales bacterium]